ncbi:MAG TPA: nitronate monooxygenase [Candidatus Ruthenibacterium merdigallinarum]|nr:nitronate monooxygenase [Candidatus Ruthenibacterium merdigallinarum]
MKKLNEILGTEFPFIQGGMANIATGEFAAAVSNAGALGLVGAGGMTADTLRENIRTCRRLTDKPFGVNIMLMHPQAAEMAKIAAEERVPVVTTGAGNPGAYVEMWKNAGCKVFPVIPAVVLAKRMAALGVDGVIAEGTESGGHVGEMTTMALVPQVADAMRAHGLPVIAAGGVADGRGLLAAYALGACGVQLGTCLLVSEECPIHENYKNAVLKAKDSDTVVTGRIGGTPVRILKNRMAREYVSREKAGADKMELEQYTLGSLRRAVFDGDTEAGSLMAGQVAGMLHEIRPLRAIFEDLQAGCRAQLAHLDALGV